jgi:hypothetical protein
VDTSSFLATVHEALAPWREAFGQHGLAVSSVAPDLVAVHGPAPLAKVGSYDVFRGETSAQQLWDVFGFFWDYCFETPAFVLIKTVGFSDMDTAALAQALRRAGCLVSLAALFNGNGTPCNLLLSDMTALLNICTLALVRDHDGDALYFVVDGSVEKARESLWNCLRGQALSPTWGDWPKWR